MERPFAAYTGDAPYIFVSYAHEDEALVYPEIQWLHHQGFNIWYDEGISPGSEWHTELAEAIEKSSLFLFFLTPRSVNSDHCQREVYYAIEHKRQPLVVHLEHSELPSGLSLSLSAVQAILTYELTNQAYRTKLLKGVGEHLERGVARSVESRVPSIDFKPKIVIATALLALLIIVVFLPVLRSTLNLDPDVAEIVSQPATEVRSSWISVLPFRAVSVTNENEAKILAEGITGALINALSGLGMFSVTSHGAVRAYGESLLNPHQMATELRVRYLMEGRVQILGQQTRISVAVVDGVEGKTLWEQTKSYRGGDLLGIQDEFTRFVNRAVELELLRLEIARVSDLKTENMSAWDHFVSGMSVWEDPNHETFAAATRAHRSALELEPNYVLSLGQLAVVIENRILFGEVSDRDVARVEACQLADRAIAQGGKSPIALFSSVNVLAELCGEANKAVQIGRRMVLAYPDSGYNQTILGNALTYSGELEEALRVLEAAERNFPDNIYVARYSPLFKAINYSHREKWDNVVEVTRTALNLDPSDVYAMYQLANGLGVLNRAEEAKEVWSQLLGRFPNMTVESYEWFLQHGYVSDERIEPLVRGLKRAGLQAQ